MEETEELRAARAMRRAVLGDEYVDTTAAQADTLAVGVVTASVWDRFATAETGADFTRIFPFIEDA